MRRRCRSEIARQGPWTRRSPACTHTQRAAKTPFTMRMQTGRPRVATVSIMPMQALSIRSQEWRASGMTVPATVRSQRLGCEPPHPREPKECIVRNQTCNVCLVGSAPAVASCGSARVGAPRSARKRAWHVGGSVFFELPGLETGAHTPGACEALEGNESEELPMRLEAESSRRAPAIDYVRARHSKSRIPKSLHPR
jgi:hypothetical protein